MKKRVLIVDDNPDNLYLLESLLNGNGLEVISAGNGREALEKALQDPPDLIISDILMPVMDGYALCRECKSDDRLCRIPFVFYTATYTEPKDEEFALSLGAEMFLVKPQDPDKLMDSLNKVLADKSRAGKARKTPLGKGTDFFRRHDEVLFKKLEKKMLDLEAANQKLKAMEENYRLSFEHVTDIIITINADFTITSISPSVETVLGYKQQYFVGRPVSDIALDCGFSSSALFSRSFKERFGAPPRVWRAGRDAAGMALTSKNDQVLRKERKDAAEAFGYPEGVEHPEWREQMEQELKDTVVEVKRLAGWKMAYVLQGKGYDQKGICAAYGKLFAWAGPRGLLTEKTRAIGMGVDNPDITPKDKCRYYAGIPVPEGTAAEGEVGIMDIAAGNYAVARFEGTPDIIKKAYGYMYGVWLPAHGYQPGDAPAFEVYYSTPDKDPRGFFSFELSVPVKPL